MFMNIETSDPPQEKYFWYTEGTYFIRYLTGKVINCDIILKKKSLTDKPQCQKEIRAAF